MVPPARVPMGPQFPQGGASRSGGQAAPAVKTLLRWAGRAGRPEFQAESSWCLIRPYPPGGGGGCQGLVGAQDTEQRGAAGNQPHMTGLGWGPPLGGFLVFPSLVGWTLVLPSFWVPDAASRGRVGAGPQPGLQLCSLFKVTPCNPEEVASMRKQAGRSEPGSRLPASPGGRLWPPHLACLGLIFSPAE